MKYNCMDVPTREADQSSDSSDEEGPWTETNRYSGDGSEMDDSDSCDDNRPESRSEPSPSMQQHAETGYASIALRNENRTRSLSPHPFSARPNQPNDGMVDVMLSYLMERHSLMSDEFYDPENAFDHEPEFRPIDHRPLNLADALLQPITVIVTILSSILRDRRMDADGQSDEEGARLCTVEEELGDGQQQEQEQDQDVVRTGEQIVEMTVPSSTGGDDADAREQRSTSNDDKDEGRPEARRD
ncbi:uncharacterized protein LOC112693479 isoform X2 [Sipha flava]|nr:uncharacterized protein LOC112693479 isoform X2 [Sipha flava]